MIHKSVLGYTFKNIEIRISKDICIPMFLGALFTIVNTWKQPKCQSVDK